MGRVGFTSENKRSTPLDFPRLKLKKDERRRILVIEDPEFAFVHDLRAPRIQNGVAEMVTKERADKTTYDDFNYDFIGRAICLGDDSVLLDKGTDPDNCPACKASRDSSDIPAPNRRFAVHVLDYTLKAGGFDIARPFSVQTLVWPFTEKVFNKLVDFATEFGSLQKRDLKLGPCKSEMYQNFDIEVTGAPGYADSDPATQQENVSRLRETFKENHAESLRVFIGREVSAKYMEDDIEKVLRAYKIARGEDIFTSRASDFSADERSLTEGLGDLLNTATTTSATAAPTEDPWASSSAPASTPAPSNDLWGGDASSPWAQELANPTPPAPAAQVPEVAEQKPSAPLPPATLAIDTPPTQPRVVDPTVTAQETPPKSDALGFDDLLAGLN